MPKPSTQKRFPSGGIAVGLVWLLMSTAVYAQSSDFGEFRVLEGVDVVPGAEQTEIRVKLAVPMRYVAHAPLKKGDELVIRMNPIPAPGLDPAQLQGRETAVVDRSQPVPLVQVAYEGDEGLQPAITLRFSRVVPYTVTGGDDFRSVIVTIPALAKPAAPRIKVPPAPPEAAVKLLPPPPEKKLAEIMTQAREAMTAGDYSRAVRLATKLLQYQEHPYRADAQELLGLARERKGQLAHARAEYEEYLRRYPEGEGAARVNQRLAALLTARKRPEEKLREAGAAEAAPGVETELYGSFSQYYYRDTTKPEEGDVQTIRSSLVTDLNLTGRRVSQSLDVRTRFTGGYEHDFLEGGDNSESRISEAYVDVRGKSKNYAMKVGRQSRSTGGVLGRFDGALLSVKLRPSVTINAVAGYPVESTRDTNIETDRYFYNVSADFGPFAKALNFDLYYHNQTIDGIADREAVGGELRYFKNGLSVFALLDYDLLYKAVNTALLLTNWTATPKTSLSLTVDVRKSPPLTTYNALQGQQVDSISDLLKMYSEDEVMQLAEDRTADSNTVTLSATHQLHDKLQIAGDVTVSDISSTPTSGGVEGIPATGTEYYYSTQLIGTNVFTKGDVSVLGFRYDDTSTGEKTSFRLNSRFPWRTKWRLNPRAEVSQRNKTAGGNELTARVSARAEYRWKKTRIFETELGYEWIRDEDATGEQFTTTGVLFYTGYRLDF